MIVVYTIVAFCFPTTWFYVMLYMRSIENPVPTWYDWLGLALMLATLMIAFHVFIIFSECTRLVIILFFCGVSVTKKRLHYLAKLVRMVQMALNPQRVKATKMHLLCLERVHFHYVQTLKFFFSLNKGISSLMLVFLLVNIPYNCTLVVGLILDRLPSHLKSYIWFCMVIHGVSLVAVPLFAAKIIPHIGTPYKEICPIFVRLNHCSIHQRVRLHTRICAFHTKKRYGFTYGPCHLISMMSILKVRPLEGRLLTNKHSSRLC